MASADDDTDTTPWQFYWKRPEYWETATPLFSPATTRTQQQHVVDHTAAVATQGDDAVLLAVTLLGEDYGIGDRVVVSLTDPATKECLKSRTLQWPTSEDTRRRSGEFDEQHQLMSPFAHREVISCAGDAAGPLLQTLGVLFNKPDLVVAAAASERNVHSTSAFVVPQSPTSQDDGAEANNGSDEEDEDDLSPFRRSRGRSRRRHGVVAASLLRLTSPTQTAEQSEAMEVLQFLSLAVSSPPIESTSAKKQATEDSSSPRELVLALLTSSGQVHIYNPMELLDEEASKRHQNDLPDMENAMTHFIFGDDLVNTLQSHILPLSQPTKTVQVTVVLNSESSNSKNNNHWDPTVERNTLAFLEPGGPWMAHSLVNTGSGSGVAVISNNEYTGAVTFVSSSSWTEKRTLFFPSPIRLAHAVVWGPLALLVLVLEEELVVAVTLSSTTVVTGKAPGAAAAVTTTSPTEQRQSNIPIARYQILLLEVPILSAQNEVVFVDADENSESAPSCVVSTKYQQSQYLWTTIDTTQAKPDSFFYYNGDASPMVVIHTQLERQARLSFSKQTRRNSVLGEGYGITGNYSNSKKALNYVGWEGRSYVHRLARIQFQKVVSVVPMASILPREKEEETPSIPAVVPSAEKDVVEEAIASISQQAFRQKAVATKAPNCRNTFTLREKARRLSKSVRCDANPYTDASSVASVVTADGSLGWVSIRAAPTPAPLLPVAAWLLHERQDYRTAASITLQAAGATDTLQQMLWKGNEEEQNDTVLEGLHTANVPPADVADFAVASLIAGHFSFTLEEFLQRNKAYHPGKACLQLAAASARAVDRSDADLWPVRCLLTVGKARDFLPRAVQLLNCTLPQELRDGSSVCSGLVSWIVSAGALELLLDVTDETSRLRYWKSIVPGTRRSLAVLSIDDRFPLLMDTEIRQWILDELANCVTDEVIPSHAAELLSADWLEKLIRACFQNAGCDLNLLVARDDGEDAVETTRDGLLPAPGSGGLDFSLIIPALLVLERRRHCLVDLQPTRAILNAACYLAGRRNLEEPLHSLNSTALMRQCTVVGDVEAGANLIGGKSGLILECCHVLMVEIGLSMEEAEGYLLSGETQLPRDNREVIDVFSIGPSHQRLLRLLREHVLSIRTYGEFETTHMRGRVDPVFASSICLKTWWSITSETLPESADWIVDWLEEELQMQNGSTSPYRLVCAALVRALIWPGCSEGSSDDLLASKMKLRPLFLIQLSQSCCGLVESLPSYVTDNGWVSPSNRKVADLNESFMTASGSFHEDNVLLFSRD